MPRHEQDNNGRNTDRQATKDQVEKREDRKGTGPQGGDNPRGGSHETHKGGRDRGEKVLD